MKAPVSFRFGGPPARRSDQAARGPRAKTASRPSVTAISFVLASQRLSPAVVTRHRISAIYAEFEAQVAFDGTVLEGLLPRRAAVLVAEWARLHTDEFGHELEARVGTRALATIDPLP